MDKEVWQFIGWIYNNYGRTGCLVCLVGILAILTLIFVLLNRLPESKTITVWSKCASCKFKRRADNVFILACPKYETPRFFYFNMKPCPRQDGYDDCEFIENQSDPAFFNRDSLPENITD
jgi:hypothetical protein